ncbi:hypothetical protein [Rhodococcus sp. HNM0569]|uniref:phage shock envelope stress response protein PspM n=1 Tax=Rhodococcus sp. HNM0569 TaxID=2716340 RepID=UPI00146A6CDC|nr:hypothetical protein [Rhodococcus sp. HNM0569]NLU81446.1 hypothetical protein [Rhodococcus sp. HNM0569]
MSTSRRDRSGVTRPVSAVSGIESVADTVGSVGRQALASARSWRDPRARERRRRRRIRRRASFFGAGAGAGAVSAASFAVAGGPDAAVVASGGVAALLAVPAVAGWTAYRRVRGAPLPMGRAPRRAVPPRPSRAHEPMDALVRGEQALSRILGVLDRAAVVDPGELADTYEVAAATADAMSALAQDVVALEQAARDQPSARATLDASAEAVAQQLRAGADGYAQLVTAAAELTGADRGGDLTGVGYQVAELGRATDRLAGLSAALVELERRY